MQKALAIALALPPLIYSGIALLFGYFAAVMQCDELCQADSSDWRFTSGAWQWHVLGGLGVAAFLAGIGFFGCVVTRKPLPALAFLLLGTAAIVISLTGLRVNPGSDRELDIGWTFITVSGAVLVSGVLAAVAASGAAPERSARRRRSRSSP